MVALPDANTAAKTTFARFFFVESFVDHAHAKLDIISSVEVNLEVFLWGVEGDEVVHVVHEHVKCFRRTL